MSVPITRVCSMAVFTFAVQEADEFLFFSPYQLIHIPAGREVHWNLFFDIVFDRTGLAHLLALQEMFCAGVPATERAFSAKTRRQETKLFPTYDTFSLVCHLVYLLRIVVSQHPKWRLPAAPS